MADPVGGNGNGGAPPPDIALQIILKGGQVLLGESPGDDLQKLTMVTAALQVIVTRMAKHETPSGLVLPSGRPDLRLG